MSPDRPGCAACLNPQALFPFTMALQPVVDLQHGRIDAYEALARGENGEGAAHVFSQVNEHNRYGFDQACRVKAIEHAAAQRVDSQLNINFMPNAVYNPKACIRATLDAAARTGFPLDRLTFERVESEGIADARHLLAIIAEYRRHGFKIALDDFATGYSGLSRLIELRPDIVKLDRVLIQDCDHDRTRLAVVSHTAALCREIGVKLVAEGIERVEEMQALRSVGVRFMQGFLFARPVLGAPARDADIIWPDRPQTVAIVSSSARTQAASTVMAETTAS